MGPSVGEGQVAPDAPANSCSPQTALQGACSGLWVRQGPRTEKTMSPDKTQLQKKKTVFFYFSFSWLVDRHV